VSPGAAELYCKAFILDANVLAEIGFPISDEDPAGVIRRIIESGVNVVKATLGGAQGNFEEAAAAIARADLGFSGGEGMLRRATSRVGTPAASFRQMQRDREYRKPKHMCRNSV